jgi:hypothetical protein
MSEQQLAEAVSKAARAVLADGIRKIEHCVAQLNGEQMWWRPNPEITEGEMNSVANLLLHLSGNIRQWIVAGLGNTPDTRNRPAEFADRSKRAKADVLGVLQQTIRESDAVIARLTPADYLATRHIQGGDVNATVGLFKCLAHFGGHVQEIVHLTRNQLGMKYKFEFVPGPKQQGAAAAKA